MSLFGGGGSAPITRNSILNVRRFGVGALSEDGITALIQSTATEKALQIRGASGQTADLFQILNDSSSILFAVDPSGNVGVGVDPTQKLDVNGGARVRGDLQVDGQSTLIGDVTISGTLTVTEGISGTVTYDNVYVPGTLTVDGLTTLHATNVNGTFQVVGGNAANLSGPLNVTGDATLAVLHATGVATFDTTVNASRLNVGTATGATAGQVNASGRIFAELATEQLRLAYNNALSKYATFLVDSSGNLNVFAAGGLISPDAGNAVRTPSYTSGLLGWTIDGDGSAEFNNVNVRGELRASVFKVNEISATAGTFGVFYSASTLAEPMVTPANYGDSFTFEAKNSDVVASAMMFGVGEIVRTKAYVNSGGVIIADVWATITARTNNGATTTYTATLNAGSKNVTVPAGVAIVDYGVSGKGFITLSADEAIGKSPNQTMAVHNGTPWLGFTTVSRLGNLDGSYGYSSTVYGMGVGQYGAAGQSWITVDLSNGFRVGHNVTVYTQLDTSGNLRVGQSALGNVYADAGSGSLSVNSGNDPVTTFYSSVQSDGTYGTFNRPMHFASTGGFLVGGGTFASPTGGWKVSMPSGSTGKIAGYDGSGTLQIELSTAGKILAGGGNVVADADGVTFQGSGYLRFKDGSGGVAGFVESPGAGQFQVRANPDSVASVGDLYLNAFGSTGSQQHILRMLANSPTGHAVANLYTSGLTFDGIVIGAADLTPLATVDVRGTLRATGNASVGGTLGVTGAAVFTSTISSAAITATGNSSFANLEVTGDLTVDGSLTYSSTTVGTDLELSGFVDTATAIASSGSFASRFRAGDNGAGSGGYKQILLTWNGGTQYAHSIRSRHDSTAAAANAIDFYLWRHGTDSAGTVGTLNVLTLTNVGAGIFKSNPTVALDVVGAGNLTGGLGVGGSLSVTGAVTGASFNSASLSGGSLSGGTVSGGSLSASAVNGLNVSSGAITSGSISGMSGVDNTPIGQTTPANGTFTTLNATVAIQLGGANINTGGGSPTLSNVAYLDSANSFTTNQTITRTTEQLRLRYDSGHYAAFTVDGSGNLGLAVNGTTVTVSADLVAASIQSTPIGGGTPSTGAFTTLSASSLTLVTPLADAYVADDLTLNTTKRITALLTTEQQRWSYDVSNFLALTVGSGGNAALALADATKTLSLNGIFSAASIQSTPVGSTSAASGAFTTLEASGAVTLNGQTTITSTGSPQFAIRYDAGNYLRFSVGSGGDVQMVTNGGGAAGFFLSVDGGGNGVSMEASYLSPSVPYYTSLGDPINRYLALYAAELQVQNLVTTDAAIVTNGRFIVGPNTQLVADLASASTTMHVKENNLTAGDNLRLEYGGHLEYLSVVSYDGGTPGNYQYTITRDVDKTGANDWLAGDAVFNTGQAGDGYIDQFSLQSSQTLNFTHVYQFVNSGSTPFETGTYGPNMALDRSGWTLFSGHAQHDSVYFGVVTSDSTNRWGNVYLWLKTAASYTGGALTWEYWNGSAWTSFVPIFTGNTNGDLKTAGFQGFEFAGSSLSGWATNSINGTTAYWVRVRWSTAPSGWTTAPVLDTRRPYRAKAQYGPTVAFMKRNSTTWYDVSEAAVAGSLTGYYGYTKDASNLDVFGFAAGHYADGNSFITVDPVYGFRIMKRSGGVNTAVFAADLSGNLSLTGSLSVGTAGALYSGQSAYNTGTGYWLEYNAGTPRMSLGSSTQGFTWDGSAFTLRTASGKLVFNSTAIDATVGTSLNNFKFLRFFNATPAAVGEWQVYESSGNVTSNHYVYPATKNHSAEVLLQAAGMDNAGTPNLNIAFLDLLGTTNGSAITINADKIVNPTVARHVQLYMESNNDLMSYAAGQHWFKPSDGATAYVNINYATAQTAWALYVVGGGSFSTALLVGSNGTVTSGYTLDVLGSVYLGASGGGTAARYVNWGGSGGAAIAAPTITTARSAGTRLVFYDLFANGSTSDYAHGVESGALWANIPTTSQLFKWYGGATLMASLGANLILNLGRGLQFNNSTDTSSFGWIYDSANNRAQLLYQGGQVGYFSNAGAYTATSDEAAKTSFRLVDALDLIGRMGDVRAWFWRERGPSGIWEDHPDFMEGLQVGPTAQQMHGLGFGSGPTGLNPANVAGLALAGVQQILPKFRDHDDRLSRLEKDNRELRALVARLVDRLN